MQSKKASKRYAKALFIAAKDKKKEKEFMHELFEVIQH